jgi:hypothetical protein
MLVPKAARQLLISWITRLTGHLGRANSTFPARRLSGMAVFALSLFIAYDLSAIRLG